MRYLGHDFIWFYVPNLVGIKYRCSVCGVFATRGFTKVLTFSDENKYSLPDILCNEYIIKQLVEKNNNISVNINNIL